MSMGNILLGISFTSMMDPYSYGIPEDLTAVAMITLSSLRRCPGSYRRRADSKPSSSLKIPNSCMGWARGSFYRPAVADAMDQNATLFDMKEDRGVTKISQQYRE